MNCRIFAWLFIFALVSCQLIATDKWSDTRISKLLPQLDCPLAVEPAIAKSFVAMSPNGQLTAATWTLWGPKSVLEAYFRNPDSLSQAVLRVRISESVKQVGPDKFNRENDELAKVLAPLGLKRMFDVRMNWGKYPIYAITAQFETKWLYAAWVGLGDPQGTTLMFELIYPGSKPTDADFALWNTFLDKTTPLPEPVYSQSFNVHYFPGYTLLFLYGAKCKIIGEQRYSDKAIQIVIDTQGSDLASTIDMITYERMIPNQTLVGPAANIQLEFRKKNNTSLAVMKQFIPVNIAPVDKFSYDATDARAKGCAVYEAELPALLKEYVK